MSRKRAGSWQLPLLAAAAGAIVLAVPIAWAAHEFGDVPAGSPHHDDVSAIYAARITTGCGPGAYCPDQPVRRDQMASFLRRGLGALSTAYAVPTGSDETFRLQGRRNAGTQAVFGWGELTALYVPFGDVGVVTPEARPAEIPR